MLTWARSFKLRCQTLGTVPTSLIQELNKQMSGRFEDLQGKMTGMSAGMSSTFEDMQGKMTGMSAGMSSTFGNLQGKAHHPAFLLA